MNDQRALGIQDHVERGNADAAQPMLPDEHPQQHGNFQQQVLVTG